MRVGNKFSLPETTELICELDWIKEIGSSTPVLVKDRVSPNSSRQTQLSATQVQEFVDDEGFNVVRSKKHEFDLRIPNDPTDVWTVTSVKRHHHVEIYSGSLSSTTWVEAINDRKTKLLFVLDQSGVSNSIRSEDIRMRDPITGMVVP